MPHRTPWQRLQRIALPAALACASLAAPAAAPLPEAARAAIERLVQAQSAGLSGQPKVSFTQAGYNFPPCSDFEAFMPTGSRPRGRVSMGLRCRDAAPWTRYVAVDIAIQGRYFVAARAIAPGEMLQPADAAERSGDLTDLPRSVVTDPAALQGVTSTQRIAAGAPLRQDLLRGVMVVQQGQTVQLVAQGPGFVISTEGRAMTQGAVGAAVRARTRDGRLVTGVADEEGRLQLAQ